MLRGEKGNTRFSGSLKKRNKGGESTGKRRKERAGAEPSYRKASGSEKRLAAQKKIRWAVLEIRFLRRRGGGAAEGVRGRVVKSERVQGHDQGKKGEKRSDSS